MARLTAVDGLPVRELLNPSQAEPNRERWALTREQRLTYLEKLPEDNEIVKGSLWADPEKAEISVEERFAQDLGIGLGSRLQFDVQGVPIELTVTSLRRVNWQTFQINFFFVVEPGVLEEAPQFRLAAARLAPGREAETQDALAAQFPNVTLIQIREVLDKVQRVLERISTGIRFLGLFTVTTGLAIVAASLGAAAFLRSREVALLKTLGLTRMEVVLWFGVEYALATALAAGTGSMLGMVAQTQILERAFTIEAPLRWDLLLGGTLSVTVLVTLTALLASLRPLRQSPADVFRS
jgi:putative ABC transport system permease protein